MSIRSHRVGSPVRLGTAGVLLAGALLSGCGVSDEGGLRSGVAAEVGDTEVSLGLIDSAIDTACGYFVDQGQVGFPRSLARQQFVSVLVQRAAAEAALDEQGLTVPGGYLDASSLQAANEAIPEDQRAPFTLLNEATAYVEAASTVLGEAALEADGEAATDATALTERGRVAIAEWIAGNDVSINPVFRLTVADGQVVSDAGGTSVPVSDLAAATLLDPQTATEAQVSAAAAELPPSQLCGLPADDAAPPVVAPPLS